MRSTRTRFLRSCLLALIALTAVIADAQFVAPPAPTQAWRHALLGGANPVGFGGIVNDLRGYGYTFYADGPQNQTNLRIGHLLKLGPANSTEWRKDFTPFDGTFEPWNILITPKISGTQYIYVIGAGTLDPTSSPYIYVRKYDTAGDDNWSGGISLNLTQSIPVGAAVASNGDLLVAAEGGNASKFFEMYHVNGDGTYARISTSLIDPDKALYDPGTNAWFASGTNPADALNAMWGSYNAGTAAFNFGQSSQGGIVGTVSSAYSYVLNMLPFGHFTVALNINSIDLTTLTSSATYQLDLLDVLNNNLFSYAAGSPGTGNRTVKQAVSYAESDPLWVVTQSINAPAGFPSQNLEKFDWFGDLLSDRTQAPVDTLFVTEDGFHDCFNWPTSSASFLERYYTGGDNFYWGKSYPTPGTYNFNSALSQFQNRFWTVSSGVGSGNDAYIDRYVDGRCLTSLTGPSTFTGGTTWRIHIHLNTTSSSPTIVALNSNTANALMPNGTQSQNFTIGGSVVDYSVDLLGPSTGTPYNVRVLAIQNGIRRTLDGQGLP